MAASGLENFNDCSQCNPPVGGLAWYFLAELTAPGNKQPLSFRGAVTETDPQEPFGFFNRMTAMRRRRQVGSYHVT